MYIISFIQQFIRFTNKTRTPTHTYFTIHHTIHIIMTIRWSRIRLLLLNLSGALYTILTICAIAILNLYFTCPDLYEDCFWPTAYALFILSQICVNLVFFHYYNKRNQIHYWTAKSAWLCSLEQKTGNALNGTFIVNHSNISKQQLLKKQQKSVHEISSFTKYSICEDGTYVDLRSELHSNWCPISNEPEGINSPTKYCNECKMVTPRRCHHCPLCGICVLRKDHHCFLLGGCAGLANQRYFIVFLFWAAIGAAYGASFNFLYLNKHVAPWFPFGWFYYLGPVALIRWALGYELIFNAFLAILFSMSFASSLGALGFFIFQMIYTVSGYTMYDFHRSNLKRVESDGENWQERLALVFGHRWWLNFILPQFWLPNQITEKIARNIFLNVSKDL